MIISHFKFSLAIDPNEIELISASIMRFDYYYVNAEPLEYEIRKDDDGHNKLHAYIDIVKDWPKITRYFAYIYRSESKDGPWEYIHNFNSYLCNKDDQTRRYLSDEVLHMSSGVKGSCVKKVYESTYDWFMCIQTACGKKLLYCTSLCIFQGDYETDDGGIFKYYELLDEDETKGYYSKIENEFQVTNNLEMLATEIITKYPDMSRFLNLT